MLQTPSLFCIPDFGLDNSVAAQPGGVILWHVVVRRSREAGLVKSGLVAGSADYCGRVCTSERLFKRYIIPQV